MQFYNIIRFNEIRIHPVFSELTWLLKTTRLINNRPMQHDCYV